MRCGSGIFIAVILLASASGAHGQTPQPRLTFDVIAIHPSQPGQLGGRIQPLPNGTGYMAQNFTVKFMMSVIYRIPARQITGGPDWFSTVPFDVEARADREYNSDDLHTMFKNLLADRFGLRFHTETKQGAVYEMVVDKAGLKMQADGSGGTLQIPIMPRGAGEFVGHKVPMEYLCWFLGQQFRGDPRPVIDKTGLTGLYDFTLEFMPDLPPGVSRSDASPEIQNKPEILEAVQEQLGLRLVPAKGPVPEYVIDKAEQPSAN